MYNSGKPWTANPGGGKTDPWFSGLSDETLTKGPFPYDQNIGGTLKPKFIHTFELAISVDPDEAAHNELPHLVLHSSSSSL